MAFLTIEANDLNEEFEALILDQYGVTVRDRSGEPWTIVFEGERDELIRMFNTHWGEDDPELALDPASEWLSDVFHESIALAP